MQFFDLNIPFLEGSPAEKTTPSERAARKKTRLKLLVKAAELGYSGVAYNRSIRGVMSESDRCSISLFPLASLLSLSSSLSSSASFHRNLLSGPRAAKSPFRQYTRLTVCVENPSQSSALNSGNPILKTYDLVAVRPMNQVAFDQACQFSEVDLIVIDFSDRMPFRLKLPMIKAAIARGVYFEITYSGLLEDIQVRRQVICNAKLLVDWTRGKNVIVSSAAQSVLDFRGPNDVANLLYLLGLATEHAKAAISKNCRSLIANTLRKKQCYKEAVRVEKVPSSLQSDPKMPWIIEPLEWDPISSGEGDLLLEDLAKSFSEASKGSETVKGSITASAVNSIKAHGLKVETIRTENMCRCSPSDDVNSSILTVSEPVESSRIEKISPRMSLFSVPQNYYDDVRDVSLNRSLLESKEVLIDPVNTSVSPVPAEANLNNSSAPDIASTPVMICEDHIQVPGQKSVFLNADSVQQFCNNVELNIEECDTSGAFAHSKELSIASDETMLMEVDDVNPDSDTQDQDVVGSRPSLSSRSLIEEALQENECQEANRCGEALDANGCEETDNKMSLVDEKILGLNNDDERKASNAISYRISEAWDGVPGEEKRDEEAECCKLETDIRTSTNADEMQHVDPVEIINSDVLSVEHSEFQDEARGQQVEGETHEKVNHPSRSATKSVKQRHQQRGSIRFPFKHLLHTPFKRKATACRRKMKR